MKKTYLLLLIIVLTISNLLAQDKRSWLRGKKVALVIGNSNYGDMADLKGRPVNDAQDVSGALQRLGFEVIMRKDVNQAAMKSAIRSFAKKAAQAEVALLFYAGHGLQVKGENYLIPIGADITEEWEVEDECIKANRILSAMESMNSHVNIVILDACRNNPFERSWNRGEGGGLNSMSGPTGSIIAFSTAPKDVAANGTGRIVLIPLLY